MAFLRRLFRRKRALIEPMHGSASIQTEAEQDVTRERMESEMASERERRAKRTSPESNSKPPAANP